MQLSLNDFIPWNTADHGSVAYRPYELSCNLGFESVEGSFDVKLGFLSWKHQPKR